MKNKEKYGISVSIVSVAAHKCSFCKSSLTNVQVYSNLKRKYPSEEIKTNMSLKSSFFNFRKINVNDTYKIYINYKVKNIIKNYKYNNNLNIDSDTLEFTDVFSCKCGKLYIIYNHTEGLKKNNSINRSRRSKKSFPKKMNVSSFF